mmetsp:Transcript_11265/g.23868  ORF Transcript_11265/g.23868 Transcript_11265/m.23868 type:complete len:288 (-) Transcript_11265:928-1791(-)
MSFKKCLSDQAGKSSHIPSSMTSDTVISLKGNSFESFCKTSPGTLLLTGTSGKAQHSFLSRAKFSCWHSLSCVVLPRALDGSFSGVMYPQWMLPMTVGISSNSSLVSAGTILYSQPWQSRFKTSMCFVCSTSASARIDLSLRNFTTSSTSSAWYSSAGVQDRAELMDVGLHMNFAIILSSSSVFDPTPARIILVFFNSLWERLHLRVISWSNQLGEAGSTETILVPGYFWLIAKQVNPRQLPTSTNVFPGPRTSSSPSNPPLSAFFSEFKADIRNVVPWSKYGYQIL